MKTVYKFVKSFILMGILSHQVIGMEYVNSLKDHVYENRIAYMTGGLVLATSYLIPTAEATSAEERLISSYPFPVSSDPSGGFPTLSECPPYIPMDWNDPSGGLTDLDKFYYQTGPSGSIYYSPLIEAKGAFINSTLYTGEALKEFLQAQMSRCLSVCPDISLIPELSKNIVDSEGYFQCAYNMQQFFVETAQQTIQPLFTQITKELFSVYHKGIYFQSNPNSQ